MQHCVQSPNSARSDELTGYACSFIEEEAVDAQLTEKFFGSIETVAVPGVIITLIIGCRYQMSPQTLPPSGSHACETNKQSQGMAARRWRASTCSPRLTASLHG